MRRYFQKGSPKIYDQLEHKVPYPHGQRVELAKGGRTPAWQRKEGKSESGGLNQKGIASYRAANPGSKLKTAVTTKPSKLKAGSKAAKVLIKILKTLLKTLVNLERILLKLLVNL
jgi:hypothetical protein